MPTFVTSEQDPKYPMRNLPINLAHVKAITKSMAGFYYSIIFQFNESQSFEWQYRFVQERDRNYNRLVTLMN